MSLGPHERVDWYRVIQQLRHVGLTYDEIGRRLGRGEATVIGWTQGSEPKHADGERLLDLWRATVAPLADAPLITDFCRA
jgi:hypothetical protein